MRLETTTNERFYPALIEHYLIRENGERFRVKSTPEGRPKARATLQALMDDIGVPKHLSTNAAQKEYPEIAQAAEILEEI